MTNEDAREQAFSNAVKFTQELELSAWRKAVSKDEEVNRWTRLFAEIEPPETLVGILADVIGQVRMTDQLVHKLYYSILNAWTHGYADACSQLADEEITLWDGEPPLDFPPYPEEPVLPPPLDCSVS